MMVLEITGKGLDIGQALRSHTEKALSAPVSKYFGEGTDGRVLIGKDGAAFKVDIRVHISKYTLIRATGRNHDVYAAVDEAVDHVTKRLRRNKRRLKEDKNRPTHAPAQHYILPPIADDPASSDDDNPIIIAETATVIQTLSVGEAVARMDMLGLNALLFYNARNNQVNMVYTRADGHIGWVDPSS